MEVIAATVIATFAVVGLAYTFGLGRGFIDRYEVARAALAQAEGRLETLEVHPSGDTLSTPDEQHMSYFVVDGRVLGTERWVVRWVDDPADGTGQPGPDPNPRDLRRATVTVVFQMGSVEDSVQLSRLLPPT